MHPSVYRYGMCFLCQISNQIDLFLMSHKPYMMLHLDPNLLPVPGSIYFCFALFSPLVLDLLFCLLWPSNSLTYALSCGNYSIPHLGLLWTFLSLFPCLVLLARKLLSHYFSLFSINLLPSKLQSIRVT